MTTQDDVKVLGRARAKAQHGVYLLKQVKDAIVDIEALGMSQSGKIAKALILILAVTQYLLEKDIQSHE